MTTPTSIGIPHRSVTSIRGGGASGALGSADQPPSTPTRPSAANFSSPSTLRAEEDLIIIEIGSRLVRVGFAGDNAPKARLQFGPDQQRRTGDFRVFMPGYTDGWRKRPTGKDWGKDHELWQYDLRQTDLGLIEDKLDRILRDAFSRLLLIDSRPRRMALIVPSTLPLPLLSTTLDILFKRHLSPTVSLLSAPVMSTIGAGVRSGLVIDLGWNESVITSVYEYREVRCTRSVRGGKMVVEELHKILYDELVRSGHIKEQPQVVDGKPIDLDHVVSFEEVEEIATRLLWCRVGENRKGKDEGLPTVEEQDETEHDSDSDAAYASPHGRSIEIPLHSVGPHCRLNISFARLAEVCEAVYFERQYAPATFDDEELPLHLLVYNHLLRLPMDVRAMCMARMMFVGGNSNVLGLKGRIYDEVTALIEERGWDPVMGRGPKAYKKNPRLQRAGAATVAVTSPTTTSSTQQPTSPADLRSPTTPTSATPTKPDEVWHDAANAGPEKDAIDETIQKGKPAPALQGTLRALETIGSWCGASLACYLKVVVIAAVDREVWLQTGLSGASRASEVDFDIKAQTRQSVGSSNLIRGAANIQEKNWTLGAWGAI